MNIKIKMKIIAAYPSSKMLTVRVDTEEEFIEYVDMLVYIFNEAMKCSNFKEEVDEEIEAIKNNNDELFRLIEFYIDCFLDFECFIDNDRYLEKKYSFQ